MLIAAIAGNEAPIIEEFLDLHHAEGFTDFALQCNGTDDTAAIAERWAAEHPGCDVQIVPGAWVDFATNRNLLLDAFAGQDAHEWMLMLDCDWHLHCDRDALAAHLAGVATDAALITVARVGRSVVFARPLLTRRTCSARYRGTRHEYLTTTAVAAAPPEGTALVVYESKGHRSRLDERELFLADASALRIEYFANVAEDPDHAARCAFYLAQSYRDAGELEQAAEWYERRARTELGYWQERYVAALNAARILRNQRPAELDLVALAIRIDGRRREARLELVGLLHRYGLTREAYALAVEMRKDVDPPGALFVEEASNDFWSSYNLALLAALTGQWGVYAMEISFFMEHWPTSELVQKLRELSENRPQSNYQAG